MDVSTIAWKAREEMGNVQHSSSSRTRAWTHGHAKPSRHDALVEQTRKWVAQSFFGPILKQMREDPFHSDLLDGGRGGQAFYALYDQELTNHMVRGAGDKLVNAIVRRIEAKNAYAKQHRSKINQEREGADRVHAVGTAESNLPIAPGSSHVAAAF